MNKRTLVNLIIFALLLSTSISPGFAQEAQSPPIENTDEINLADSISWNVEIVDGGEDNSAGAYPSLVFNSGGIPYISYYNNENGELWYAKRVSSGTGNCGEGNTWLCQVVDTDGDVGKYSSIDYWKSSSIMGSWKLGISYYDTTNRALKLAIYSCIAHFSCSWSFHTIQQASTIFQYYGRYSSLKFSLDGDPLVAYQYSNNMLNTDTLRYAYPVTEGGNCGLGDALGEWQCDSIESGEGMGMYPSLSITWDGTAYIAYYDQANGNLKFSYYIGFGGNCGPASGWDCKIIDGGGIPDVGLYASLATPQFSGDKFRIAYHDKTNGKLKIAYTHAGGNCYAAGWQCDIVDDTNTSNTAMGISLATDESGHPIIAYQITSDYGPGTLHVAQSAYALGLDWGNCGDVPPGNLFQYWQCETVDNASGYTSVADYTAVAVAPSGLAMIAYNEVDEYDYFTSLKVAYQERLEKLYLPLSVRAP